MATRAVRAGVGSASGKDGVKIILRLMWVTFAVGTRWSALGVGVGLGEGREG